MFWNKQETRRLNTVSNSNWGYKIHLTTSCIVFRLKISEWATTHPHYWALCSYFNPESYFTLYKYYDNCASRHLFLPTLCLTDDQQMAQELRCWPCLPSLPQFDSWMCVVSENHIHISWAMEQSHVFIVWVFWVLPQTSWGCWWSSSLWDLAALHAWI